MQKHNANPFGDDKLIIMERSILGDDILTCPNCLSDSGLVIGWFPISESDSKEYTRVGCKKCKTYFSENVHWHAVIFWNNFAITEFAKKKKIHSVYGCNTGPFWIIKAQYVNKNGKLTDGEKEFWERDQQQVDEM